MKRSVLFSTITLLYCLLTEDAGAQWLIRTDPLNLVFQNYNVGLERQKNRHITGVDVSYLNRGWVWQFEFPGTAKATGVRLNLDHKVFFRKASAIYAGGMLRLEKLRFKNLTHQRADYHYTRDDRRLTLAGIVGVRVGKGRFKTDFGIGPAIRLLERKQELLYTNAPGLEQPQEELTEEALRSLSYEPSGFLVKVVPMLHLQTSWKLGPK